MNQKWQVIYYISPSGIIPVQEFLDSAKPVVKTKALRILFTIEEYGLESVIPHIKKLTGTPLWEIRIMGSDSVRILFVTMVGKQIVLLHAFFKKTQKTPQKEIMKALARMRNIPVFWK